MHLDSIGKSTTAAISIAEVHSPSVEIVRSCDEVSLGHGTKSDSTVPLNQINKKSTIPRSSLVTGHALSDDSELVRDEVPLDLCSSRSAIPATLGPLSSRRFVTDDYDSENGISETDFGIEVSQKCMMKMRRVRVRALPFRRVELLPP